MTTLAVASSIRKEPDKPLQTSWSDCASWRDASAMSSAVATSHCQILRGSWDLVDYNWGYKSPKWGYPNYNLLITLLTKSHEPLSSLYRRAETLVQPPAACPPENTCTPTPRPWTHTQTPNFLFASPWRRRQTLKETFMSTV